MSKFTGIKRNFFYNSILTLSGYIFPFLTFPYVSRILGVSNIGIYNFVDNVINYYVLFSMMGIAIIGIRLTAKYKNNSEQLNKTFTGLFALNTINTFIALIALGLSIYFIPQLQPYKNMMYIGSAKVLFNLFLIEWFYKGIENFKYITIRSLIIKTIYVVTVFVFVRKENDYVIYYLLTILSVAVNAAFNWYYKNRFVSLSRSFEIKPYIKPFLILGFYMLLTSMYTTFNIAYLGFVTDVREVGYYATATKLYSIILALFTAFTSVMLPRISSLLAENKIDEVKALTKRSFDILFYFSFPLIIFSSVFAPQIIQIIAGDGYEGAIIPMRIIMPLILIIGIEQILIIQLLMPLNKDKAIFTNSLLGALVGITLNVLLVSHLKSIGSAIVWIVSELTVLLSAAFFARNFIEVKNLLKKLGEYTVLSLPAFLICIGIYKFVPVQPFILLSISGFFILLYYFIIHIYFIKDKFVVELVKKIKSRF